jgi:hypothetical protein
MFAPCRLLSVGEFSYVFLRFLFSSFLRFRFRLLVLGVLPIGGHVRVGRVGRVGRVVALLVVGLRELCGRHRGRRGHGTGGTGRAIGRAIGRLGVQLQVALPQGRRREGLENGGKNGKNTVFLCKKTRNGRNFEVFVKENQENSKKKEENITPNHRLLNTLKETHLTEEEILMETHFCDARASIMPFMLISNDFNVYVMLMLISMHVGKCRASMGYLQHLLFSKRNPYCSLNLTKLWK